MTVEREIVAWDAAKLEPALACVRTADRAEAQATLYSGPSACGEHHIADTAIDGERAVVHVRCAGDADLVPYALAREAGMSKIDVPRTRALSYAVFEKDLRAKGANDTEIERARDFIKGPKPPPIDAGP